MDEIYPFDITGEFDLMVFDKGHNILRNLTSDSIKINENVKSLDEFVRVESFINLQSMMKNMDQYIGISIDITLHDGTTSNMNTIVVRNSNETYSMIFLPNEDRVNNMITEFHKTRSEVKSYSDDVFHDVKQCLSQITISLNNMKKKHGEELTSEIIPMEMGINSLSKMIEDLLYFIEIDKKSLSRRKCKWKNLLTDGILQSLALCEHYSNERLRIQILINDVSKFDDSYKEFKTFTLERVLDTIYCNKELMLRAIVNILDNAIKYSRERKDPLIRIELNLSKSSFSLTIIDNGIGIKKHEKNKIMERGFRSQSIFVQNTEGHGLGLSIVNKVVIKHNLNIRFETDSKTFTRIKIWS